MFNLASFLIELVTNSVSFSIIGSCNEKWLLKIKFIFELYLFSKANISCFFELISVSASAVLHLTLILSCSGFVFSYGIRKLHFQKLSPQSVFRRLRIHSKFRIQKQNLPVAAVFHFHFNENQFMECQFCKS